MTTVQTTGARTTGAQVASAEPAPSARLASARAIEVRYSAGLHALERPPTLAALCLILATLLSGCSTTGGGGSSEGGRDSLDTTRLDPQPTATDDPVDRVRVAGGSFQNVTVGEVAKTLASQSDIPFLFYGEGIEDRVVSVDLGGGTTLRQAASALARAADCHYAYYANVIDETAAGIKMTVRPYRSYARGELGRLNVVHP